MAVQLAQIVCIVSILPCVKHDDWFAPLAEQRSGERSGLHLRGLRMTPSLTPSSSSHCL